VFLFQNISVVVRETGAERGTVIGSERNGRGDGCHRESGGRESVVGRERVGREGGSEMLRNPKPRLYTSPVEDRYGLLLGLGAGPLFLEAGLIVCPPPERDLQRRSPEIEDFWRQLSYDARLRKSILGGSYFLTTSINRFYEANKRDRLSK